MESLVNSDNAFLDKVRFLVERYKRSYEFKPGISKIALMEPTFGYEEILEAIDSLLSYKVTMGSKVQLFEREFSDYIGSKYSVMVNSGSSANLVALSSLADSSIKNRIGRGDEIITPAVTWSTTVFPINDIGAIPVFVDVELRRYTAITEAIEKAITPRTKAIMPVHLLGFPCNMDEIMEIANKHDLFVIEDCCEAHGAKWKSKSVGSFGDVGTFSFFFSHHISTIEGGMVAANDLSLYDLLQSKRAHGWIRERTDNKALMESFAEIDSRFLFVSSGFNVRPTEIQGAFGTHQLKKLDKFIEIRRNNARSLNKILSSYEDLLIIPQEDKNSRDVWFGYPILLREESKIEKQELIAYLSSKNIETRPILAGNITVQPVMQSIPHRISGSISNSKLIHNNGIFIGNHQGIGKEELEYVAECLTQFFDNKKSQLR